MTAMWPLPLLSTPPSLPAGQCKRVTDVGMRRAAKCSSLRVQSRMLISISSVSCSNTDLSHSRALSWAALYLPCTWTWLPLGEQGQIVWFLCGSRLQWTLGHVGQDILALACQVLLLTTRWGERIGGWVNDVKTTMVICLNAGWWWWLVASWCWVDWCWPMLHYGALTCGTYCVIVTNPLVPKKPSCKHCYVLLGQWEGTWQGRRRSVGTEGPIKASSNHTYPRNDTFANIII